MSKTRRELDLQLMRFLDVLTNQDVSDLIEHAECLMKKNDRRLTMQHVFEDPEAEFQVDDWDYTPTVLWSPCD